MLDPNNDFNAPCYDDTFRRNYIFDEEFGNVEYYFIELDYYIMREAYKSRRKQPLDLDIKYFDDGGDGECIFRDVSQDEKSLLETRGYVVLEEHIDIGASDFGDIYHVTEVYGYEPKDANGKPFEFVKYESMLVNSYGWVKASSDSFSGAKYNLERACLEIPDEDHKLSVGDILSVRIAWAGINQGSAHCQPTTVTSVLGGNAYANCTDGTYYSPKGARANINQGVFAFWTKFPNGIVYENNVGFGKGIFVLTRVERSKNASQNVAAISEVSTFSFDVPSDLQMAYQPYNPDGTPAEVFSDRTKPSVSEHFYNIQCKKEILVQDEVIERWHGLYRRITTKSRCQ